MFSNNTKRILKALPRSKKARRFRPALEKLEDRTTPAGLVSWWRAESNANDFAGSNNGVLQNGATFATGMIGQAFQLDGVDDFIDVADSPSLDAISSAITVESWIKPELPLPSFGGYVFSRRDPFVNEGFSVDVLDDGRLVIAVRTATAGNSGSVFVTDFGVIHFSQYQHIAAEYDGTTGTLKAFVDGQEVPLVDHTGLPLSGPLGSNDHLFIGRRQDSNTSEGVAGASYFNGMIDDLAVYDRALTAEEVQEIFNAGSEGKATLVVDTVADTVAPDGFTSLREAINASNASVGDRDVIGFNIPEPSIGGLVARWHADGNANDSVGTNDGALIGEAGFGAGAFGSGFLLDGVNDNVEVPHNPNLDPESGSFTLDAWVRSNQAVGPQMITSKFEGGGINISDVTNSAVIFWLNDGILEADVRDTDKGGPDESGGGQDLNGTRFLADGQFHHVALVRDIVASELRLYVDGTLEANAPLGPGASGDITDEDGEADPFLIGARTVSSFPFTQSRTDFFAGGIDEVEYYAQALTGDEIVALYQRVQTIRPTSPLPTITDPVFIDGYTQPGAAQNTNPDGFNGTLLIELNGENAGFASGLTITAGNSTVRGLAINRFQFGGPVDSGSGILLAEGSGNHIEGNFIGTNVAGTAALGNGLEGVLVGLFGPSSNNTIGGTTPQTRNLISGNRVGVDIRIDGSTGNVVQGNLIGTDVTGMPILGNRDDGVLITNTADNNVIGGLAAGAANVISGNQAFGVEIASDASQNQVVGNTIATNLLAGVTVDQGGNRNSIRANSIFSNGGLGFDLGNDGVTPNDPGDGDTGSNNLQNFPVITSASSSAGSTTIQGTFNSTPGTNGFRLEFFAADTADPSGFGEGQTFLGSTVVNTDGSGNATFTLTVPVAVLDGQFVTATATDPAGNTSEFSRAVTLNARPGIYVSDVRVIEGNSGTRVAEFLVTLLGGAVRPVTVYIATAQGTAAASSDYYSTARTLVFRPGGPTTQIVRVRVVGDRRVERDETFFLNVLYARGAAVVDRQGVGSIVNDDGTSTARFSLDAAGLADLVGPDWLSPSHPRTRKWPW
jgi:CSLREA domain-containing protein